MNKCGKAGRTLAPLILVIFLAQLLVLVAPMSRAAANSRGEELSAASDPNEKQLAARVIRLAHSGSANGTVIATFERWNPVTHANLPYLLRKSTDDGRTWTDLAALEDGEKSPGHPFAVKWTPSLIELPAAIGQWPAGTLIMVAVVYEAENVGHPRMAQLQQWRSVDRGSSWTYGGKIAESSSPGIWEPFLYVGAKGQLIIHYADDDEDPAEDQTIAQLVSTDAGASWSPRSNIVVGGPFADRPGMPVTTRLPDGTYRLVYELCEFSREDPRGCPVHIKSSTDGMNWGSPSDLGIVITSTDGRALGSSPYIVWAPGGGPQGQLIVSGGATRRAGNPLARWPVIAEENMQTLMVSYDLGTTWYRMPTPFRPNTVPATAECSKGGVNWSATLLPSVDGTSVRVFTPATLSSAKNCRAFTGAANVGTLPYRAAFAADDAGWVTYGGSWSVSGGAYRDTSGGGGGPKAMTGSTGWTDYTAAADVTLSAGDGGVLFRVTDPGTGSDALRGYYAGIGVAGGLFVGRMNNGSYATLGTAPVKGGVAADTAYRVTVLAAGSRYTISVTRPGSSAVLATLIINDTTFGRGQIGIRHLGGNATFDNVHVDR